MLLAALGCGPATPAELEALASACPEQPASPFELGVNAYYLQEEATRALRAGLPESERVEETFRKARALGATVVRTWAFNDEPSKRGDSAIQPAPLEYDEISFRGLDLVLSRARAHGLRLVLPLGNSWSGYGGARQYVRWAGLADPKEADPRFFSDRRVVAHYRAHLRHLLNRVNTFDGLRYGEHPSVASWELLNEPRAAGLEPTALRAWLEEVGQEVKSLAPGPLLGTGEEGFQRSFEGHDQAFWRSAAPGLFAGTGDFRENLGSPVVELASIHFFPESWGVSQDEVAPAGARWISEHAEQARAHGKPLFLGEMGLRNQGAFSLEERRALYRGWLRCARRSGLWGAAVWLFAYDSRPDEWDPHTFYFRDGSEPSHPDNRYADLLLESAPKR